MLFIKYVSALVLFSCLFFSHIAQARDSGDIFLEISQLESRKEQDKKEVLRLASEADTAEDPEKIVQDIESIKIRILGYNTQIKVLHAEKTQAEAMENELKQKQEELQNSTFSPENNRYPIKQEIDWTSRILLFFICFGVCGICYFLFLLLCENKIELRTFFGILLGVFLFGLLGGQDIWYSFNEWRSPGYILSQKYYAVNEMRDKLKTQLKLINDTKIDYKAEIEKYTRELRKERQEKRIVSYSESTSQMRYTVWLIQQRNAYLEKLTEIENATKNGFDEAVYMSNQLAGARGMTKIISSGKKLANDAEGVLSKYEKYTEKFGIKQEELSYQSPEKIRQLYK